MFKALIIDDETELLGLYSVCLTQAGFEVETQAQGLEAFISLGAQKYDVIICDLNMPTISGQELLLEVRQSNNADTPIMVVSGFASDEIRETLSKLGNIYFLDKPFSMKKLLAALSLAMKTEVSRAA